MTIREAVDAGVLVWRTSTAHIRIPTQYLRVNASVLATAQQAPLSQDWHSTVYIEGKQMWRSPLYQNQVAACLAAALWLDKVGIHADNH
jgi:hypothetical protein